MARRSLFERYLFPIAVRHPRLGIVAADLVHRLAYRFNLGQVKKGLNTRADWKKLLGEDAEIEASEFRYIQSRNRFRQEFLDRILKKATPDRSKPLARWKNIEALKGPLDAGQPVIIALSHAGPLHGCIPGLLALNHPISFLVFRSVTGIVPEGWELFFTAEAGSSPVQSFKKCRERLKSGRPVAIACDVFTRETLGHPVTVFDMPLRIMRGFAALARSSGAAVIPVSIQWVGMSTLLFEAHPPLSIPKDEGLDREGQEAALLHDYAQHIDRIMRANPCNLHPHRVDMFLTAWERLKGKKAEAGSGTDSTPAPVSGWTRYGATSGRTEL